MSISQTRKILIWASLLLYFCFGFFSASDAVLCLGPQGHISVEHGRNGRCADAHLEITTQQRVVMAPDCNRCNDIPLLSPCDAHPLDSAKSVSLITLVLPLLQRQRVGEPYTLLAMSEAQLANPPPMRSSRHTFLKTVIIQI